MSLKRGGLLHLTTERQTTEEPARIHSSPPLKWGCIFAWRFFFLEGVSRFQTTSLVLANLSQALRVWEHLPQIKIKEEKGGTFPWASYNNGIKCRSKKMTSLEGQESQMLLGHGISIPYP